MNGRQTRTTPDLRLLPLRKVGRNAVLSGVLSLIPVFGVLIGLTYANGSWPLVAAGEATTTILLGLAYWRYRLVYLTITADTVVKRSFVVPRVEIAAGRIASVVIARIYRSHSTESYVFFVAFDGAGRRLFRLSGLFWSEAALLDIANTLDTVVTTDEQPVALGDFYRAHPGARFWYERRPYVIMGIAMAVVVVTYLLLLVETAIGTG